MTWMRALTCTALVAALCGCPEDPDPTPDAGTNLDAGTDAGVDGGTDAGPGGPLSEVPLWQVEGDRSHEGGCFGRSLALGDLNADGHKDLLVTSPPCDTLSKDPGRISIYAGQDAYYAQQPITATMTWRNTSTRTSGRGLVVSTGNVNGDAYADVLVTSFYGVSVYAGGPDLTKVFSEPVFRAPGNGTFSGAVLADLDGDGLDDLASTHIASGGVTVSLSTPFFAEGTPFTAVRTLEATSARRTGDVNQDGAQDLMVTNFDGALELYLGCRSGSPLACTGPLTTAPVWTAESEGATSHPDINGDGRPELFRSDNGGSLQLHLSDPEGFYAAAPVWRVLEDAAFVHFGSPLVAVGDMDGDGERNDFVAGALGRLYLFTPKGAVSSDLRPTWAWPRADRILPATFQGFTRFVAAAPGDLNRDGYDDVVVGIGPEADGYRFPGKVVVFGGGLVPAAPSAPPYLPEVKSCELNVDLENGKPDLTVDGDVLARTLYVDRRTFAADACEVQEGCVPAGGERRLLRFSTSIVNKGRASAIVPAPEERPDLFQWDECHGHHHLTDFAAYELRDAEGNVTAVGRKQGFYLVDYSRVCPDATPFRLYDPGTGISPGWSDVYTADIACQWLDITDMPDGDFSLRVGVDEKDVIDEDDRLPNEVTLKVRIDGDTVTVLP